MVSVRVVTVDHYMSKPIKELRTVGKTEGDGHWIEPVIRIFGPTSEGIKTCVHIHGVYPYMYVPYRGGDNPDRDALLLGAALDQALAVNSKAKNPRFIYKVILISGIPLYGYHSKPRQFFKIYFFNPYHIKRACDLLLSGAILGQKLQPHEAHIPFILQFMIDYNIYGMSFINLDKVKYRRSPTNPGSLKEVESSEILPAHVKRNTYSYWEVDALAEDITNNRSSGGVASVNPGLQAIWEDERNRRRVQNRVSQITPQTSQTRPEMKYTSNELMHRQRLAQRLQTVVAEKREEETPLSYPAEVGDDASELLEASAVGAANLHLPSGVLLDDVNDLIDEKILTQLARDGASDSEEEQPRIEDDSVLGRNQRDDDEAELEDEDGGDMTQPLEMLENVIQSDYHANRDERGNENYEEDEFWRKMADNIMQLDGADDLSSLESDEENRKTLVGHPEFLSKAGDVNPMLDISGHSNESISNWSTNIMSILNESTGFAAPQSVYQTPQTFWTNWTPKMNQPESLWAQNNADSWAWDKNDSALLDCLAYSVKKTGKTGDDVTAAEEHFQASDAVNAADLYGFPSGHGEYFNGSYTPTSTMSPISNVGSVYNISPPSAILTPSSEIDSYSDVNLDSISQISNSPSPQEDAKSADFSKSQVIESKTVTLPRTDTKKSAVTADHKDLIELLRKFSESRKNPEQADGKVKMVALTLKQYIKTCGEIVNVDFKNLSGKEMIVVEYKPVNSKSNQNKYLIKPLDKFLEDWAMTEEKLNNSVGGTRTDWPRLINGFADAGKTAEEEKQLNAILNTLENKYTGNWLDESKIKSIKNKFIVKSIEMLPENGDSVTGKVVKSDADKSYKINENVISNGKIKMRLIKDGKMKKMENKMSRKGSLPKLKSDSAEKVNKMSFADYRLQEECTKTKVGDGSDNDEDLIDQINRSFEDYFKTIVKISARSSKNEIAEEEDSASGEDEPDSEPESDKSSAKTIKFITQLLSALASLSHSSEVPPISLTINFGNGKITPSVQFNFQAEETKKKRSKKLLINNFDGPADTSSSEDSVEGKATVRTPNKKRPRKELAYRPLNVVIPKTATGGLTERKRKLPARNLAEEVAGSGAACYAVSSVSLRGRPETPEDLKPEGKGSGSSPKQEVEAEDLTRFGESSGNPKPFPRFDKTVTGSPATTESDFIGDSEDEDQGRSRKKRRMKRLMRKVKRTRVECLRVPQTDMVSSSEGEDVMSVGTPRTPEEVKGIVSFYDTSATDLLHIDEAAADANADSNDVFSSLLTQKLSSQVRSQPSSEENYNQSGHMETSPELTSVLQEIAVNSDQSLKREDDSDRECEVQSFELSGSLLHRETSPVSASPSLEKESSSQWMMSDDASLIVSGSMTVKPKMPPPTFQEVKATLADFDIPETAAQVPYYSNANDISKQIEVGGRVLKIENYSIAGLKPHVSETGLIGTEERRKRLLQMRKKREQSARSDLVGRGEVCITPLTKPPTWQDLCRYPEVAGGKTEKREAKTKLILPRSPGQDSETDDETDLSLTLPSPKATPEAGPSTSRRLSFDESSASNSPSFPDGVKHSTPVEVSPLRKGPLHRIKGVKRLSLMGNLPTIVEERTAFDLRKSGSDSSFGIKGVTPDSLKNSVVCLQHAKAVRVYEYVTMLVLELHVQTRGTLRPDPEHDPIRAVFYTLVTDGPDGLRETGVIAVGEDVLVGTGVRPAAVHYVPDEKSLLDKLLELIRVWDPDILTGYEIEMHSWGYLFQRSFVLEKNLFQLVGRVVDENQNWKEMIGESELEDVPRYIRHMRVTGRIVLDVWRLFRHEVALTSYTFENVTYHILRERHPKHSYHALSFFWEHPTRLYRHITAGYFITRTEGIVRLLEHVDFLSRNSELARLFGIQFYEVLSRGSQFRVESMMLRLAKPLNYVPCSPSIKQRASMRAPASLPLIMEPESMFYADPVIVLDFQSLYPSMIIAYNYCFSTCIGRVEMLGGKGPFEFGCTHLQISPEEIKSLEDDINISPAGIGFVRANIRKGVLPSMLEEILETRLMVKKSMKENKTNKNLQKVLHARQLGLKLIANVTYGYTAANFSGRMPCIEVGDSVVSKGRETLQRAIEMVKKTRRWGAKVVYGDTDSLFVLTPGKTREEAFKIGSEIADAVTQDNPRPVKLKLEKVYQPSILQTKKRYVGYMYETPEQEKPVYDAKGIETVRRDGCPATGKILQKALEILFETKDVSQVKRYTIRQFAKLFQGRINVQDLVFAKEYRGRRGYRPGACVPALELAKRWTQTDKRAEPRVKERVPYVIVNGPPGLPLIRLVRSPRDLFLDPSLRVNAVYYITKAIIPPMQRCFSLLGADVMSWYAEMPRRYHKMVKSSRGQEGRRRHTISQYFATVECAICSEVSNAAVCPACQTDKQAMAIVLHEKIRRLERNQDDVLKVCAYCCDRTNFTDCESLDCPILYRRHQIGRDFEQVSTLREISHAYLDCS